MENRRSDRIARVHLLERRLPSGKIRVFLDIYDGKSQWQESTGILLAGEHSEDRLKKQAAEHKRAEREKQILVEAISGISVEKRGVSFFQYAEKIIQQKHGTTQNLYKNAIEQFEAFLQLDSKEEFTFEKLSKDLCVRYANHLKSSGLKRNTAAAYFFKLKSVLKQAEKDEIILASPAKDVTIKLVDLEPKYLTIEDLKKLAKANCGNLIVRDAFFFSCLTGMSYVDLVDLKWHQINADRLQYARQKTKQPVSFQLNGEAIAILKRQVHQKKTEKTLTNHEMESVFKMPSRQTIDKILKRWGKRAGIPIPLSMHKARHTFGTLAHAMGADIYTVSALMGHRNLSMTQKYAKVIDPRKNEAVSRLPRIQS